MSIHFVAVWLSNHKRVIRKFFICSDGKRKHSWEHLLLLNFVLRVVVGGVGDVLVFKNKIKYRLRFFSICVLVGFGVLTPLNFTDNYLSQNPNEKYGTLEKLTILNISFGSKRYTELLPYLLIFSQQQTSLNWQFFKLVLAFGRRECSFLFF
jgi:hypothetical protein